jgi:hypothetical protein
VPGQQGQDVGKLTASIAALQKQVSDLQLKATATPPSGQTPTATPAAGENGQAQQAQGTVGSSTVAAGRPPATAQGQAATPLGKPDGVPMGQDPVIAGRNKALAAQGIDPATYDAQRQQLGAAQKSNTPVPVPPNIDAKIKSSLQKNQGQGTTG